MEQPLLSFVWRYLFICVAYFICSFSRRRPSDLLNQTVPQTISAVQNSYRNFILPLTKQDQEGCPSSSFSVHLAPCPLLLPHCSWGSHSPATVSLVLQAHYPRRAPVSPSGAQRSLRAQLLPTVPPQVCHFCWFVQKANFSFWHVIFFLTVLSCNISVWGNVQCVCLFKSLCCSNPSHYCTVYGELCVCHSSCIWDI